MAACSFPSIRFSTYRPETPQEPNTEPLTPEQWAQATAPGEILSVLSRRCQPGQTHPPYELIHAKLTKLSEEASTQQEIAELNEILNTQELWDTPGDTYQSIWMERIFKITGLAEPEKAAQLERAYYIALLGLIQGKIKKYDFANIAMHWAIQTTYPEARIQELPIDVSDLRAHFCTTENKKIIRDCPSFMDAVLKKGGPDSRKLVFNTKSMPSQIYNRLYKSGLQLFGDLRSDTSADAFTQFPPSIWKAVADTLADGLEMQFYLNTPSHTRAKTTENLMKKLWPLTLPAPDQRPPRKADLIEVDCVGFTNHDLYHFLVASTIPSETRLFFINFANAALALCKNTDNAETRERLIAYSNVLFDMELNTHLRNPEEIPANEATITHYLALCLAFVLLPEDASSTKELCDFATRNGYKNIHDELRALQKQLELEKNN